MRRFCLLGCHPLGRAHQFDRGLFRGPVEANHRIGVPFSEENSSVSASLVAKRSGTLAVGGAWHMAKSIATVVGLANSWLAAQGQGFGDPQPGGMWLIAKKLQHYRSNARKGKGTDPFCAQRPAGRSGKRGLSPFPLRKMLRMLQFF